MFRSKEFIIHGDRLRSYNGTIDRKQWPSNSDKDRGQGRQTTAQLSDQNAVGKQPNSRGTEDSGASSPNPRAGSREQAVQDKDVNTRIASCLLYTSDAADE